MRIINRDSLRILHLEENNVFISSVEESLRNAGFNYPIITRRSCAEAVNYLSTIEAAHAPHVILLNVLMDGAGGMKLINWLRQIQDIPDLIVYLLNPATPLKNLLQDLCPSKVHLISYPLLHQLSCHLDYFIALRNEGPLEHGSLSRNSSHSSKMPLHSKTLLSKQEQDSPYLFFGKKSPTIKFPRLIVQAQ